MSDIERWVMMLAGYAAIGHQAFQLAWLPPDDPAGPLPPVIATPAQFAPSGTVRVAITDATTGDLRVGDLPAVWGLAAASGRTSA